MGSALYTDRGEEKKKKGRGKKAHNSLQHICAYVFGLTGTARRAFAVVAWEKPTREQPNGSAFALHRRNSHATRVFRTTDPHGYKNDENSLQSTSINLPPYDNGAVCVACADIHSIRMRFRCWWPVPGRVFPEKPPAGSPRPGTAGASGLSSGFPRIL